MLYVCAHDFSLCFMYANASAASRRNPPFFCQTFLFFYLFLSARDFISSAVSRIIFHSWLAIPYDHTATNTTLRNQKLKLEYMAKTKEKYLDMTNEFHTIWMIERSRIAARCLWYAFVFCLSVELCVRECRCQFRMTIHTNLFVISQANDLLVCDMEIEICSEYDSLPPTKERPNKQPNKKY